MNKKKCRIIILTVIIIGMIAFIPSLLSNIININNNSKIDDTLIDNDIKTKTPTLSKYISTYNGSGGVFNVTLHQSLVNYTKIEITNTSDTDNITFYEKCPTDTNFNTSFINITIEDIYAPDKNLIVEDTPENSIYLSNIAFLTSFNVSGSGFLENFSLYLSEIEAGNGLLNISLFNSTWDSVNSRPQPNEKLKLLVNQLFINEFTGWYNFTSIDYFLDSTNTENNTFFISCIDPNQCTQWFSEDKSDGFDTYAYRGEPPSSTYQSTRDFTLKLYLTPLNNTPNPEDIGLKINNTYAKGYSNLNGSGYWNPIGEYSSSTGNLKFNISAEWWDVSCNIKKAQLNYTKTNITGI